MIKDNLVQLRNIHGFSQEQVAEKLDISRQAYAKWESGATIPDIEKCSLLAELYEVSLDSLVKTQTFDGLGTVAPAPKGKNIWGSVILNDRGQVVIPKEAREHLKLTAGERLIVLSDDNGIALVSAQRFEAQMRRAMELAALDC